MKTLFLIGLYLIAIVAANVLVAAYGPGISIVNAFLFIGLDLTTRDQLHDAWHGHGLVWKMFALILAGSLLSYWVDRGTAQVAFASLVSFAAANLVDALIYGLLRRRTYMVRVNGSNLVSALVDSIVFPTIAFGALLPLIVLGQFAAKVLGGALWSFALHWRRSNRTTEAVGSH